LDSPWDQKEKKGKENIGVLSRKGRKALTVPFSFIGEEKESKPPTEKGKEHSSFPINREKKKKAGGPNGGKKRGGGRLVFVGDGGGRGRKKGEEKQRGGILN